MLSLAWPSTSSLNPWAGRACKSYSGRSNCPPPQARIMSRAPLSSREVIKRKHPVFQETETRKYLWGLISDDVRCCIFVKMEQSKCLEGIALCSTHPSIYLKRVCLTLSPIDLLQKSSCGIHSTGKRPNGANSRLYTPWRSCDHIVHPPL